MRVHGILTTYVFLGEQIVAFVVEDHMYFFSSRSTYIWSKHNVVGALPMHIFLIYITGKYFGIATITVYVLFMLHFSFLCTLLLLFASSPLLLEWWRRWGFCFWVNLWCIAVCGVTVWGLLMFRRSIPSIAGTLVWCCIGEVWLFFSHGVQLFNTG